MRKKYIILIAIMIIYCLILFFFVGLDNLKGEQREATIIIDTETAWKLEKNNWVNIINNIKNGELDDKLFTVFINNENIGNYYLEKSNSWLLFDEKKNPYSYELGSFFAIRANYSVNILNTNYNEITDMGPVNKVLASNNIMDAEEFTVKSHYQIDFDNDGIKENFYAISNAFARETAPSKVFSIVFMEKDNQIYYLYNSIDENDGQNGCKPYINTVIDLDYDQNYEIIVSCGYYSIQERNDMLYTFKNNKFNLLIDNQ